MVAASSSRRRTFVWAVDCPMGETVWWREVALKAQRRDRRLSAVDSQWLRGGRRGWGGRRERRGTTTGYRPGSMRILSNLQMFALQYYCQISATNYSFQVRIRPEWSRDGSWSRLRWCITRSRVGKSLQQSSRWCENGLKPAAKYVLSKPQIKIGVLYRMRDVREM